MLYRDNLSNEELDKRGHFKVTGVPSAVYIAAAISGYARILINKFKNIPENTCYYSDTDSVILQKELPNNWNLVGRDLGQIKLEYKILAIPSKYFNISSLTDQFLFGIKLYFSVLIFVIEILLFTTYIP